MTARLPGPDSVRPLLTYTQSVLIRSSVSYDGGLTRYVDVGPDLIGNDQVLDLVRLGLIWPVAGSTYELTDEGLVLYNRLTKTERRSNGG